MTTAFAQEQAQQPSSAQDRQEQPHDTGNQIPVLIRLPDLATSTITVQAGSQLESDRQELASSPQVAQADGNAEREQSTTKAERVATTSELPKTAQRQEKDVPWWSEFRVPPAVIHAAVALSLVAVFIIAYMAIVGSGDKAKEIAADKNQKEMASNAGNGKASAQEDSALDFDSFVPKGPQKPAAGGTSPAKPAGDAAKQPAAQQSGGAAKQPAAKPNQPPAKKLPGAAAKQLAAKLKQSSAKKPPAGAGAAAVAAKEQASHIQQAEFESPADSSAGRPASKPPLNQVQTDRPQGFRNENLAPQNLAVNNLRENDPSKQPLISGETARAANQPTSLPPVYPMTNPASYQYPADYHERLLSPADAQDSPRSSPWSGGGAGDDQRPSTARLQPRIEPPPIR